ncbi:hypothetical protein [Gracilibacillus salinarum]|uniref:DUF4234 domain-containing protein n=1 Tax=Gracilibacillus salinarum TaxID=2932255 RepID=A0ABY4GHI7_9BACI|nr:hypothetical protein [Gracilibacillus salinarum]UOQ83624.1 hypothetical protein MUN87_12750 [Gracilibacillus salinarum]
MTEVLKKKKLWIVILLSIVTLGIYVGYWFLSAKSSFQLINKKNYIPFKWWIVATIYLSLSLIISVIGEFVLTIYGLYMLDSMDLILTYFYLALLYYSIYRVKELLEEYDDEIELNKYLLFFFHIWYIQYKMNQAVNRGLANEKTA